MTSPGTPRRPLSDRLLGTADRAWLVALAAAFWGLDGVLRQPLTETIAPATIVLWEHVIIVALLSPTIPSAVRAFRRCSVPQRLAVLVIGAGASAGGTALFTAAISISGAEGDFVTPLVLQKLQPVVAILLAVVILGERLRPRFLLYAIPALAGAWFLAFREPLSVQVAALQSALLALGAAMLWASGTVLGRYLSATVTPRELTALRFGVGLVAAFGITLTLGDPLLPEAGDVPGLILLALIPGLLALRLYYVALQRTAAARATLAELAFPATSAVVGVLFLGTVLVWSQWVGLAVLVVAVTLLGLRERTRRPSVQVPEETEPVTAPAER